MKSFHRVPGARKGGLTGAAERLTIAGGRERMGRSSGPLPHLWFCLSLSAAASAAAIARINLIHAGVFMSWSLTEIDGQIELIWDEDGKSNEFVSVPLLLFGRTTSPSAQAKIRQMQEGCQDEPPTVPRGRTHFAGPKPPLP
jgi:hypothetical protein